MVQKHGKAIKFFKCCECLGALGSIGKNYLKEKKKDPFFILDFIRDQNSIYTLDNYRQLDYNTVSHTFRSINIFALPKSVLTFSSIVRS